MENSGGRQVLGLWSGGPEQVRCAEQPAEDRTVEGWARTIPG